MSCWFSNWFCFECTSSLWTESRSKAWKGTCGVCMCCCGVNSDWCTFWNARRTVFVSANCSFFTSTWMVTLKFYLNHCPSKFKHLDVSLMLQVMVSWKQHNLMLFHSEGDLFERLHVEAIYFRQFADIWFRNFDLHVIEISPLNINWWLKTQKVLFNSVLVSLAELCTILKSPV